MCAQLKERGVSKVAEPGALLEIDARSAAASLINSFNTTFETIPEYKKAKKSREFPTHPITFTLNGILWTINLSDKKWMYVKREIASSSEPTQFQQVLLNARTSPTNVWYTEGTYEYDKITDTTHPTPTINVVDDKEAVIKANSLLANLKKDSPSQEPQT